MAGNTFGNYFKVTTFGESHGKAIGAVIDGCPAGIQLFEDDFAEKMNKRNPEMDYTTTRKEPDKVNILSGVNNGVTLGTPICLVIYNEEADPSAYSDIKDIYRPAHADYTYDKKYGIRDYRGGGRASGRETAARVAAGVVASKILDHFDIKVSAKILSLGGQNPENAKNLLEECSLSGDSLGGAIECTVSGIFSGVGEPVFDKLDAKLAQAMISIPGAKGFEIGDGFELAKMKGSDANDPFCFDGKVSKKSNHCGGVLGGISDGDDIVFRVAFKPTPSISKKQDTIDSNMNNTSVEIKGKHDTCYCLRCCAIVEAMADIVLADLILANNISRIDMLK